MKFREIVSDSIYRDIISHYAGEPERQEHEFSELVAMLKKAIMPP